MRRRAALAAALVLPLAAPRASAQSSVHPERRWYIAAESMRERALSWGDQPYGAVVVLASRVVGEGPSRVVKDADAAAHAERVAIREARRNLGRDDLAGAVLYSTSRPCAACEEAAARAGIVRMYYGAGLTDGGPPRAAVTP